jgi:predicted nucleic acid-binding protein
MQETSAHLLLSDDRQARAEAARLGLPLTGTVGLLRLARDRGLIDAAYPLLLQLRRPNFWISDALLERIANEER